MRVPWEGLSQLKRMLWYRKEEAYRMSIVAVRDSIFAGIAGGVCCQPVDGQRLLGNNY